MLLSSAVIAAGASAQSLPLPATDTSTGGVDLKTGPDGVKLGVHAGDSGGVTVGAGPGGVDLGLRTSASAPPATGRDPGERVSVPDRPAGDGPGFEASPEASTTGSGPARTIAVTGDEPGSGAGRAGRRGDRSGSTPRVDDPRAAARAERDGGGGVAPVFDLVERIPAAVRAGLVALALIALAMWALWVRGRRRLQHNAYLDPDTDVANMAAFDQVLDREWQRATRYGRPLGLVLLELQDGPGGMPLVGERDARDAVDGISEEVRQSDMVARLAPSRFAVICPEAPQGSIETLAHALEHRLEERRLRCWVGFGERNETDGSPADLVARAATALAHVQTLPPGDGLPEAVERDTVAFPEPAGRVAAGSSTY
jgi:GGDEF domain-containing protein